MEIWHRRSRTRGRGRRRSEGGGAAGLEARGEAEDGAELVPEQGCSTGMALARAAHGKKARRHRRLGTWRIRASWEELLEFLPWRALTVPNSNGEEKLREELDDGGVLSSGSSEIGARGRGARPRSHPDRAEGLQAARIRARTAAPVGQKVPASEAGFEARSTRTRRGGSALVSEEHTAAVHEVQSCADFAHWSSKGIGGFCY